MPCYDKKLEAVRPNFTLAEETKEPIKEIDTVLATHELIDLFELKGIEFDKVPEYQSEDAQMTEDPLSEMMGRSECFDKFTI